MFDPNLIKTIFDGVIGWDQNSDINGVQLESSLVSSSSGIKYNSFHPLLTFNNLYSIAPDYESIHGSLSPSTKALIEADFSNWLRGQTQAATIRAFDIWTGIKLKNQTTRNLLERNQLFDLGSVTGDVENQSNKTKGIEITTLTARGLIYPLKKIGVQLEQAETFTIYLFHTSSVDPITTLSVTYTEVGSVQWFDVDWKLSKGSGSYYICYNSDDLTGGSINGNTTYNYNGTNQSYSMGRYFSASPFTIGGNNTVMWDTSKNIYDVNTNHGLNVQLSAVCDFSEFIIEQKDLFRQLVGVQLASDLLRMLAYNVEARVNRFETNIARREVLYEVDGDTQGRAGGLKQRLDEIIEGLQLDTQGIDKHCLPCRRRGMKYKSI